MNTFKILKATYYDPQIGVGRGADVTEELSAEVVDGKLFYNGIYNFIFSDPFIQKRKKLKIEIQYLDKTFTKFYDENEKINLPHDLGEVTKNQPLEKLNKKISEIESLKANSVWGAEYQLWLNITEKLVKENFGDRGLKLFNQQNSVVLDDEAYIKELDSRKKILEGLLANKDEYMIESGAEKKPEKIGILNTGKNNTFIGNTFHGHDIGIKDEGKGTFAKANEFFSPSHGVKKLKHQNIVERVTNNATFAIVIGSILVLLILYFIYIKSGVNLSQFN